VATLDRPTNDEIRLTLPRNSGYYGVAHLVVGGLAVRMNLTLETLEDLKLAFDELLDQEALQDRVTVVLQLGDASVTARVGPVDAAALGTKLEQTDGDDELGLGRMLHTLVDRVEVVRAEGADWVEISKGTGSRDTGG
jgi:hypothetical protein